MKNGSSNGILVLAIERGNEINIEYSKKNIIDKINSYFGYKLIGEIKIQTFSSKSKKIRNNNNLKDISGSLQEKINQIKNENIKNSLSQLLKTIKND
jgi:hypothetical protein